QVPLRWVIRCGLSEQRLEVFGALCCRIEDIRGPLVPREFTQFSADRLVRLVHRMEVVARLDVASYVAVDVLVDLDRDPVLCDSRAAGDGDRHPWGVR